LSDRIRLIDALRGLALAGIAIVHFGEQYLGYMPPPGVPYNVHGPADGVLEALAWIFIRGKGFGLFSLMFGLSFALQMQRAERRLPGRDFRPRFAWRLLILFVIGGLHGLLYSGDILTVYALLGLPLMLFYRVRDRWLLVLALVLGIGIPRVVRRVAEGPAPQTQLLSLKAEMDESAAQHWHALSAGDVPAILRFHAGPGFQAKWAFQFGPMGRGYQTFALFLVGLWAGRRRLFENVEPNRPLFERIARWTGALTLGIPLLALGLFLVGRAVGGGAPAGSGSPGAGGVPDFSSWAVVVGLCVFDAWNAVMTAFYVALFVLLFQRERWRARLVQFAPVGRMALTSYLAQTAIGSLVFFGFGLGLLGRFGNTVTLPLGAIVFAFQVWLCRAWLDHYRFGPVEWLWRSLTWLRWQPFRQPVAARAPLL